MDISTLWNSAVHVIAEIPRSGLLMLAVIAVIGGWLGAAMVRRRVPTGRIVSSACTLLLVGVLVTVVLQLSRFDPRLEMALPSLGLPEQVIEGGETRVKMAPDGHFWLRAEVNGRPAPFLVDTGATLTAISAEMAQDFGLRERDGGIPIMLNTANGTIAAKLTTIDHLRFGGIEGAGLDAVIAPNIGDTNVLGMNFLSRLQSWRVEGDTLILVPKGSEARGLGSET